MVVAVVLVVWWWLRCGDSPPVAPAPHSECTRGRAPWRVSRPPHSRTDPPTRRHTHPAFVPGKFQEKKREDVLGLREGIYIGKNEECDICGSGMGQIGQNRIWEGMTSVTSVVSGMGHIGQNRIWERMKRCDICGSEVGGRVRETLAASTTATASVVRCIWSKAPARPGSQPAR